MHGSRTFTTLVTSHFKSLHWGTNQISRRAGVIAPENALQRKLWLLSFVFLFFFLPTEGGSFEWKARCPCGQMSEPAESDGARAHLSPQQLQQQRAVAVERVQRVLQRLLHLEWWTLLRENGKSSRNSQIHAVKQQLKSSKVRSRGHF